jgi:DNA polymerase-3 subunit epsilon
MGKLENETFVCIDCEATGLDPTKDRIVEVAVVKFTFQAQMESFETLINPNCEIPELAISIHHITQEMVQGKPKIQEVIPQILQMIGSHVVVGHSVKFDLDIIFHEAERFGIPCQIQKNRFVDTLRLARLYGDSPSNALKTLGIHFNVPSDGGHRAMSDVQVNIEVFKHLSKRYDTLENLFTVLSKPILMKTMPLGKHKGRLLRDIPLQYLQYAAHKDFDLDLSYSIRQEIKKRRKGNLFQQSTNPFKDL